MTTPTTATISVARMRAISARKMRGRPEDGRWGERVLTKGLRATRIPVVPPHAIAPITATTGWLYDLLTWTGVDKATARHVQDVILKPLSVVVIILVAVIVGWLGSRM